MLYRINHSTLCASHAHVTTQIYQLFLLDARVATCTQTRVYITPNMYRIYSTLYIKFKDKTTLSTIYLSLCNTCRNATFRARRRRSCNHWLTYNPTVYRRLRATTEKGQVRRHVVCIVRLHPAKSVRITIFVYFGWNSDIFFFFFFYSLGYDFGFILENKDKISSYC